MGYYKCHKCAKIRADDFIILTNIKGLGNLIFNVCDDCIRDYNLKVIDLIDFGEDSKTQIFLYFENSEPLKKYELSKPDVENLLLNDKILLTSKAFLKDLKKQLVKEKEKLEIKIETIRNEVDKNDRN